MRKYIVLTAVLGTCYSIIIKEAFVGESVSFVCPSNDNNHRFQFWQLPYSRSESNIIGPGINFSEAKYKYEVLTGKLNINQISANEHGIFMCHCKNIFNNTSKVDSVDLIVKENWINSYETDYMTNIYRCVIIVCVSMILICILCILYHLRNKNVSLFPDFTGDSHNEHEDEQFLPEAMEMTAHLDTEFPREFTTTAQIN